MESFERFWEELEWEEQRKLVLNAFDLQCQLVNSISSERNVSVCEVVLGVHYEDILISLCRIGKINPPFSFDRSFGDLANCLLGHACEEECAKIKADSYHFGSIFSLFGEADRHSLMMSKKRSRRTKRKTKTDEKSDEKSTERALKPEKTKNKPRRVTFVL